MFDHLRLRLDSINDNLRASLWYLPGLMTLAAAALAVVLTEYELEIDREVGDLSPWIFKGDGQSAASLLATIAGSIITVTGVVFSITMVALVLASNQFSPRVLRHFMEDKITQVVLGGFLSTFVYCLLVLRSTQGNEDFVPATAVTVGVVLGLASLGLLIIFIHHIAQLVQVANILKAITEDTVAEIAGQYPALGEGRQETPAIPDEEPYRVQIEHFGYVQRVDENAVVEIAKQGDLLIRLESEPGDFVSAGQVVASIWPATAASPELDQAIAASFLLGTYPSLSHDVEFGIRQVVDIGVKALSPAVNDPTTATNAIDHLGVILSAAIRRDILSSPLRDDSGRVRLIIGGPDFEHMLHLAFDQVRHYGRGDRRVLTRVIAVLRHLSTLTSEPQRLQALINVGQQILQAARRGLEDEEERQQVIEAGEEFFASLQPAGANPEPARPGADRPAVRT